MDRFGKLIGIIMEETLTQINKDLPSVGESSVVPVSRLNDLLQIKGQGLTILEIQRKLWSPPIVFYFRKKVTMELVSQTILGLVLDGLWWASVQVHLSLCELGELMGRPRAAGRSVPPGLGPSPGR